MHAYATLTRDNMARLVPVMLRLEEESVRQLRELRKGGYLPAQLCRLFIKRGLSTLKHEEPANQEPERVKI